ncbi:hypothetical protein BCR34DRAFT_301725 [Clohesyomyces aquaticus]|uniref:Zn(2)-C6 fungal-type domain-containing protein n=1 Tax=Clohesyomyces aquaticus TaxID=1231657 RepID=A0A1Y1ZPW9_9PLEO|nr:hypothetical protein BCR34DRAFT_301725 [Clohesyomyces aquaticus]
MFPHQGGQGQLPTHWQPPTSQQPANGSYPPPPSHINTSLPPPPPQEPRPDMAAHQHPQQPYRLPGPHEWSRAPPPPDPYRGQPPPANYMNHGHHPPAPRQRTAIACRYCRRRKIRCSGFEATDDGRCSNCMRFNQDCIFTPVSAQTQAFVPAHTVWRGVGQPPPMYGAYGQPLPPANHGGPYEQAPRQQQQYLPSPTGATAPSSGPYPSAPPPPGAQPYYASQPPRRSSPQSAYSYDASRASSSPHTQAGPSTPGASPYYTAPPATSNNGLQPAPPRTDGRSPPPPTSQPGNRPGMRINDLVTDNGPTRSSTDSDMLNMLNRRPM